jgi:uncharacterized protein
MGNAVVHFEFCALDDGPLVAFYGELFGWALRGDPGGGYTGIDTCGGTGINGGIGKSQTGEPWSAFYVEADDPRATLEAANALGATTVLPATNVGDGLTIAMFRDPDDLLIGLIRAAGEAPRPAQPDAPGEAVTWFEILGSEAARTQRFYTDLFDWTIDSEEYPGYRTIDTGTSRGIQGGIGGGAGACWAIVYAEVTDIGQTLRRAEKLGGSSVADPEVSALKLAARTALYGSADDIKMAAIRDPAGNLLGISEKSTT